jgi:hypothetical protein
MRAGTKDYQDFQVFHCVRQLEKLDFKATRQNDTQHKESACDIIMVAMRLNGCHPPSYSGMKERYNKGKKRCAAEPFG